MTDAAFRRILDGPPPWRFKRPRFFQDYTRNPVEGVWRCFWCRAALPANNATCRCWK